MCDLLIRYPANNQLWLVGCTDSGNITTTPVNIPFAINDPSVIDSGNNAWSLTADSVGRIVTTSIGVPLTTSVHSESLISAPSAFTYNLTINTAGLLGTTLAQFPSNRTTVPRPVDIAMSQWPDSIGVTTPTFAGATVTVSADMSCWCCAIQSFVKPEDTTIIVYIDE